MSMQVFEYADEVAAELKQSLLNLEKTNTSLSGAASSPAADSSE
jgi:hypothetical protein